MSDQIKLDEQYIIVPKHMNDIIAELNLDNDDKLLCETIIRGIEKEASENIRAMKVVSLPFIGCIRINPVKRLIRDNYKNFRLARQHMTKEQYKEHVKSYVNDIKNKQKEKDFIKLLIKKIKSNNKDKYEKLCIKLGRKYANMYIYAIYLLEEVPFDAEFEEQYQSLKD